MEEAVIQLPDRKTFTVKAPRKEDNEVYICSMKLNGEKYTKNYITHADLLNGGRIEFQMSERPNKLRGIGDEDVPYSFSLKRE